MISCNYTEWIPVTITTHLISWPAPCNHDLDPDITGDTLNMYRNKWQYRSLNNRKYILHCWSESTVTEYILNIASLTNCTIRRSLRTEIAPMRGKSRLETQASISTLIRIARYFHSMFYARHAQLVSLMRTSLCLLLCCLDWGSCLDGFANECIMMHHALQHCLRFLLWMTLTTQYENQIETIHSFVLSLCQSNSIK